MIGRRLARIDLGVVGVALLGLFLRLWAASFGPATSDGDEAVFVLLSQHLAQGRELAAFFWGQRYLGTAEALAAAPFLAAFPYDVFAARIGSLVFFTVALLAHAAFVRRWWGPRAAVLSAFLLTVPSWRMLWATDRPITMFGALSVFGTAAVYLSLCCWSWRRACAIGLLLGLAFWTHPMGVMYAAACIVPAALGSPVWARVARSRLWVLVPPALGLAAVAAFADACDPRALFASVHLVGLAVLGAFGLALLAALGIRGAALTAGMGVGLLPVWIDWLAGHGPPTGNALPACTSGVPGRALLELGYLLPYVWGLPLSVELPLLTVGQWLLALPAIAMVLGALGRFGWRQRSALGRLMRLTALTPEERPAAALAILFAGPIALVLLAGNAVDHLAFRFLVVTWQAGSVLLALFVVWLATRWRIAAAALFALYVWQSGIDGLRHEALEARAYEPARQYADAERLAGVLAARGIDAGYADYYLAYQLDVLTRERVTFAPYNGISRYQPYEERAGVQRAPAFVLPAGLVPGDANDNARLVAGLMEGPFNGPARPELLDLARRGGVQERLSVGSWDVWLVRRPD